jgi:hypothetical protein
MKHQSYNAIPRQRVKILILLFYNPEYLFTGKYMLAVGSNCRFVPYESYQELTIVMFNGNIQMFASREGGHFVINSE